jgi:hypothetical protein
LLFVCLFFVYSLFTVAVLSDVVVEFIQPTQMSSSPTVAVKDAASAIAETKATQTEETTSKKSHALVGLECEVDYLTAAIGGRTSTKRHRFRTMRYRFLDRADK